MKNPKKIPAAKARIHLGQIMKQAVLKGDHFIVEKSGIPMVAILSADEYTRIIKSREERFKTLEKIRLKIPSYSTEETEDDISKAVKAVRHGRS